MADTAPIPGDLAERYLRLKTLIENSPMQRGHSKFVCGLIERIASAEFELSQTLAVNRRFVVDIAKLTAEIERATSVPISE
jgi:hypothetical protein